VRIEVIYKLNEKGQKVKITKKIKQVNKKVEERKKWKKFGEARDAEPGQRELGISSLGEEITMDLSDSSSQVEKKEAEEDVGSNLTIICRNCGRTGHWTLKCPYKIGRFISYSFSS
jgi:translation initiation factor 3 subunit G